MRYFFFFPLVFLLSLISYAQTELPDSLKNPVGFVYSDYSHPKFYYGIRKMTEDLKSYQDISLQSYEIIYEIGHVRSTTPVRKPQILLGFYGVDFSKVSEWEPMECKPSDTTIQPCVHNLLSDILIGSADILGIRDLSNCRLLVFNIFKDKLLYTKITEKMSIPENCGGIFYLLWNKENKPDLPAFLSSSRTIMMAIEKPVKIPRKKLAFMEPPPSKKTKSPETVSKKDKVIEKPTVSKEKPENPKTKPVNPTAKPARKGVEKNKLSPKEKPDQKPSNPVVTEKENNNRNESSLISIEKVSFSPDISSSFLPDLINYLSSNKIAFNNEANTLSLSKQNDTVYIWNKSKKQLVNSVSLPLIKIPVLFSQDESNRRGNVPDPEARILNRWNAKKMTFSYKGQQMYFDRNGGKLNIPEIVSSVSDMQISSEIPASLGFSGSGPDTVKVFSTYQKFPVKINILDSKTKQPVKDCPIKIIINKKIENVQVNEEIYSLLFNSGNSIPDLYKNEIIKYRIIFDHPDFKQVIQLISDKDINEQKTILLEREPCFAFVYVEPELLMREYITHSLDKRKEFLIRNSTHFLLFISNTDRPLVIYDSSSYTRSVHQIATLPDDKPNLQVDYQSLVNTLKNLDISNDSIKMTIYMSASLYRREGKEFITSLVKNVIGLIYNKEPEVYIYTDVELSNEEKIDEIKYHYNSLFKD